MSTPPCGEAGDLLAPDPYAPRSTTQAGSGGALFFRPIYFLSPSNMKHSTKPLTFPFENDIIFAFRKLDNRPAPFGDMFYVYILKSQKTKKLYIGFTSDLRRRFIEHNKGITKSTKHGIPWKLVYYESFQSKLDAVKRENALKYFGKAYGQLKHSIQNSLD